MKAYSAFNVEQIKGLPSHYYAVPAHFYAVPGVASLILFAILLTRVDSAFAGRAYAAYGGVYIAASLIWLWGVEGHSPDRWDIIGALFCLGGAAIILWGPRTV